MESIHTILLAEDDKSIAFLIEQKIRLAGYEISTAKDGEEALEALARKVPDLVLLDIDMPKKNGLEVLQAMKKDALLAKVPVIVISNSGSPIEVYNFQNLGVKDYFIKAELDPEELIQAVHKYLPR